VDVLAFHGRTGALLVTEVKTVMPDLQAMISTHDRKARLGMAVAHERGWRTSSVSRLLVMEASSTARDRVERFGAAMDAAYPARGGVVRTFLRSPAGSISGLLFVRSTSPSGTTYAVAGRQRVRRRGPVRCTSPIGTPGISARTSE